MSDQSGKTDGFGIGEAGKAPASTPLDEIEAARLQPIREHKMVKCACGHTIPSIWVMRANLGSSCPDCYDDMSN